MGLKSGLCAGQSSTSTPKKEEKLFFMDLAFAHRGTDMLKQEKGLFQSVDTNLEANCCLNISVCGCKEIYLHWNEGQTR